MTFDELVRELEAAQARGDQESVRRLALELRSHVVAAAIEPDHPRSSYDELRAMLPDLKDPDEIERAHKIAQALLFGALARREAGDTGHAVRHVNECMALWLQTESMRLPSGRYRTAIVEAQALRPLPLRVRLRVIWWTFLLGFYRRLGR